MSTVRESGFAAASPPPRRPPPLVPAYRNRAGLDGFKLQWFPVFCVAIVVALQVTIFTRVLSLILLLILAILTPKGPIQALSLVVFVTQANFAFAAQTPLLSALKWVVPLVCGVRLLLDYRRRWRGAPTPWKWPLALYGAVILALVIAVSSNRELSFFKLISWFFVAFVALYAFERSSISPTYWFRWFYSLYCATLLLSVPLLLVPAGRFLNGRGFQGIFWHPQALGVFIAPFTAVVTVNLMFGGSRSWIKAGMALLGWFIQFESLCRTAMLAIFLGVLFAFGIAFLMRSDLRKQFKRSSIIIGIIGFGTFSIGVLAAYGDRVINEITEFTIKGRTIDPMNAFSAHGIAASRSEQVGRIMQSISNSPLAGVGFGLSPESVAQQVERDQALGLPVGAPTEQGFLPLAIMCQTGIIGSAAWLILFGALCWPIARRGSLLILVLFWVSFFVNFGEMIFFATGGLGTPLWLVFALCMRASSESEASIARPTPVFLRPIRPPRKSVVV